jgi:hypothetical protein
VALLAPKLIRENQHLKRLAQILSSDISTTTIMKIEQIRLCASATADSKKGNGAALIP